MDILSVSQPDTALAEQLLANVVASKPAILVSVGIPTYNRPHGLKRTLDCITAQTYRHIEIIVSDNDSPGTETESVVRSFMSKDARIRYVRQPINLGPHANFQFVLSAASGQFFMWAADDDEWSDCFIEFGVNNIGDSGSIMTSFDVHNRAQGSRVKVNLPVLSGEKKVSRDISAFIANMQPTMFYGLHRRERLQFFLTDTKSFDWLDCHICMQLIWNSGFVTRNDVNLYTAGIDEPQYVIKKENGRRLNPIPFFLYSLKYLILAKSHLSLLRFIKILLIRRD